MSWSVRETCWQIGFKKIRENSNTEFCGGVCNWLKLLNHSPAHQWAFYSHHCLVKEWAVRYCHDLLLHQMSSQVEYVISDESIQSQMLSTTHSPSARVTSNVLNGVLVIQGPRWDKKQIPPSHARDKTLRINQSCSKPICLGGCLYCCMILYTSNNQSLAKSCQVYIKHPNFHSKITPVPFTTHIFNLDDHNVSTHQPSYIFSKLQLIFQKLKSDSVSAWLPILCPSHINTLPFVFETTATHFLNAPVLFLAVLFHYLECTYFHLKIVLTPKSEPLSQITQNPYLYYNPT